MLGVQHGGVPYQLYLTLERQLFHEHPLETTWSRQGPNFVFIDEPSIASVLFKGRMLLSNHPAAGFAGTKRRKMAEMLPLFIGNALLMCLMLNLSCTGAGNRSPCQLRQVRYSSAESQTIRVSQPASADVFTIDAEVHNQELPNLFSHQI